MKKEMFVCDIGKEIFENRAAVQNSITLVNGEDDVHYNDVCPKCVKKVAQFIKEQLLK